MDRRLWQIGVLGSECLDRRSSCRAWIGDRESGSALVANQRAWIGVLGSAFFSPCLDRSSSCRAWIGDRESGSALVGDRCAWIGVLRPVFFSSCLDWSSSRRRAPCLDRNFRKFGIESSENVGIEWSLREDSRIKSGERERLVSGERGFELK